MKEYPTISRDIVNETIYAFDKLDGSNVRAEWSKKRGFYKFGKRHGLVDESDPMLGESKKLILDTYSEDLSRIFSNKRVQKAICYFEFFGPSSFAGNHDLTEAHEVVMLDVAVDNRGFLSPAVFLKEFENIKTAKLLYHGKPGFEFVESVKNGTLPGMTFEGVVCKGSHVRPGRPLMFKIKNKAWIEKLKIKCLNNPELFDKLV